MNCKEILAAMTDAFCKCGSNELRFPLKDDYGFLLAYVCDKCVGERRKELDPEGTDACP